MLQARLPRTHVKTRQARAVRLAVRATSDGGPESLHLGDGVEVHQRPISATGPRFEYTREEAVAVQLQVSKKAPLGPTHLWQHTVDPAYPSCHCRPSSITMCPMPTMVLSSCTAGLALTRLQGVHRVMEALHVGGCS